MPKRTAPCCTIVTVALWQEWCHPLQYAETILEMGEEKTGVINVLIQHLVTCWSVDKVELATAMIDIVTRALVFGPMHSRGKRYCGMPRPKSN